jgi:hypothetical protein
VELVDDLLDDLLVVQDDDELANRLALGVFLLLSA